MNRVNEKGAVLATGENKTLERVMLQSGIRSAAMWDLKGIMESYAGEGLVIDEHEAELWFSVCGDRLQEEAARAGERFARALIQKDVEARLKAQEEVNA